MKISFFNMMMGVETAISLVTMNATAPDGASRQQIEGYLKKMAKTSLPRRASERP